ncbi:Monoacylglycerol lipase ABHD12 [Escovopsis weberi]|uniref:Monoacylglycerol lipase ABHD12 n=1 Tax=Escovopsis weberi TaxID=150374 RepID=A0A0M9VW33_ESCWE|nr:Monoacylglycerol lipase ABHD12 [Escovopsis weberi]
MSTSSLSIVQTSLWVIELILLVYTLFVLLVMIPLVQKHVLYAHKINSLSWTDLNKPESWGFARGQVTPFGFKTPDGETIYAWHIMPLPLYLQHEHRVSAQATGFIEDFSTTESFQLLKNDPETKLVLYFHGNAGHLAETFRPSNYHTLTDTSSYHVIAIDYRGFGHSTGEPSEDGLITDAEALVEWVVNKAGIAPGRIVLLGQSLGTAVVSGVAEKYVLKEVEFAGLVLVSGFSDLATMLSGYKFGGVLPALGPYAAWPPVKYFLDKYLVDKWHSANRVANIVRHTKTRLRLNLVHAKDDGDIPWTEDNKLFKAAVKDTVGISDDEEFDAWKERHTLRKGDDAFVTTWKHEPNIIIRQELFPFGSHNSILGFAPVLLAIMRSFDLAGTGYEDHVHEDIYEDEESVHEDQAHEDQGHNDRKMKNVEQ